MEPRGTNLREVSFHLEIRLSKVLKLTYSKFRRNLTTSEARSTSRLPSNLLDYDNTIQRDEISTFQGE